MSLPNSRKWLALMSKLSTILKKSKGDDEGNLSLWKKQQAL
jgi:hypothetical protein